MTSTTTSPYNFLAVTPPFDRLPPNVLESVAAQMKRLRYRMGQAIVVRETLPSQVAILYEGQARLLGYSPQSTLPDTLERLQPGALIGWAGLVRGVACETVIASVESVCLTLSTREFRALLQQEPDFAAAFQQQAGIVELYDLLALEVQRRAIGEIDLTLLAQKLVSKVTVLTLPKGKIPLSQLEPNLLWLLSGGTTNFTIGDRIDSSDAQTVLQIESPSARLIGIGHLPLLLLNASLDEESVTSSTDDLTPYAPQRPIPLDEADDPSSFKSKYPHVHGRGPIDGSLACFQMLSQHWNMPFRRDVMKRALVNQNQRARTLSLGFCGAVAELMGLTAQLATVPAEAVSRLQTPVMLPWQGSFALLYKASEKELVLAVPEQGIQRRKPADFIEAWGEEGEVLLLQPTKETPQKKFGLHWFLPSVIRHRRVLIEVLIASFFVQLFTLANPLITQVIIDKVLVQNGGDCKVVCVKGSEV